MSLDKKVLGYKDELLKSLQRLIRIRSVEEVGNNDCPYGNGVNECLEAVLEIASELGFKTYNMDHHIGWCEYGDGDEMIAVLGHLDVVPEGDAADWSFDPFGGEIKDGKIFGRGTMDDKGPLMTALYALAAIKDRNLPINKRVRIIFGTNEETGSDDMKYYKEHGGELPSMGFTPDGNYPVINGEKGIINVTYNKAYNQECKDDSKVRLLEINGGTAANVVPAEAYAIIEANDELEKSILDKSNDKIKYEKQDDRIKISATGLSAHGATPELGVNAIGLLLNELSKLPLCSEAREWIEFLNKKIGLETNGKSLGIDISDDISGFLSLNLGTIRGDEKKVTLVINYRYPVTKSYEDCAPVIDKAFATAGFTKSNERHSHALYIPEDSKLVSTLLDVYKELVDKDAKPKSIGGGTYAKSFPNVVAFGPVFPDDEVREHMPDEFIEIDRLMQNACIYAEAIYRLAR